jgi:Flp pilus assembly protein TadD
METEPPHPLARRELALTIAEQGDFGRAVELFEHELRATRRPDATLYTNLGLAHARAGHVALAEAAFKQALVLDPKHRPALDNLAALYQLEGRLDEAEVLGRAARDLGNPGEPPLSK